MTSIKLSRKRIVQALGLLALGLVLLVGSADFGHAGGHSQIVKTAQQQQEPATFEVEAVVNARGGLDVPLTAIPGSPRLQVTFVVRGDTNPHRLVDPGTPVSILGIAKESVTAFTSASDVDSLLFFVVVPPATATSAMATSGQPTAGVTILAAEVMSLIPGLGTLTLGTQQNKVLLTVGAGRLSGQAEGEMNPSCCERNMKLTTEKGSAKKPSNATGVTEIKGGNRVIEIKFDIDIEWQCDPTREREKPCVGSFSVWDMSYPKNRDGQEPKLGKDEKGESFTYVKASEDRRTLCKDVNPDHTLSATITVTFRATYPGDSHVRTPPRLVIEIEVPLDKQAERKDHGIWHSVAIEFNTNDPKADKNTGNFPVKVTRPVRLPPPPKK